VKAGGAPPLARLVHVLLGAAPERFVSGTRTLARGSGAIESLVAFAARPLDGHVLPVRTGPAAGVLLRGDRRSVAWLTGKVERAVQGALMELLTPGDVFLDVGAATGFFSVIGGRLVGRTGTVIAFEPEPSRASAIRTNAALNELSNVTVVEAAVSDADGSAFLADPASATAHLVARAPRDALPVVTVSIDAFLEACPTLLPALVKVDVEGNEQAVLRGMERTLRQGRPTLIVELHGDVAVVGPLEDAGYSWTPLDGPSLEGVRRGGHLLATPLEPPAR